MKITNISDLQDGFGECFKFVIYAIFYCDIMGHEFYYTPFSNTMKHNYDNDIEYIKKKEELINIIHHYKLAPYNCQLLNKFQYISFFEKNVHLFQYSNEMKKIKQLFREKNKSTFDNQVFNIAVHIRRFHNNVDRNNPKLLENNDISDEIYIQIINHLRMLHPNSKFHIYSQGDLHYFECYNSDDIVLHIDEPLEKTYTDMVLADALVVSPSALSYTAGILSDGIVYYIPHCHKPLNHWIRIDGYTNTFRVRYKFIVNKNVVYYDSESELFYKEQDNQKIKINIFELLQLK